MIHHRSRGKQKTKAKQNQTIPLPQPTFSHLLAKERPEEKQEREKINHQKETDENTKK